MALTPLQRDCLGLMTRHDIVSAEQITMARTTTRAASAMVSRGYAKRVYVGDARIEHFKITDTGRRAWREAMGLDAEVQGVHEYEPHPFEPSGRFDLNGRELCFCDQLGGHRSHLREGNYS